MKWHKLVLYDMRHGLLRNRYFFIPFIVLLPCFSCWYMLKGNGFVASVSELLLFCFKGARAIENDAAILDFQLPIYWLLIIGGCLLMNLDYLPSDLTSAGQQVIIRCDNRTKWFLSKCIWNISSSLIYFTSVLLSIFLFAIITDGQIFGRNDPVVLTLIWDDMQGVPYSIEDIELLLIAIVLPFSTICALNMLEMTLCLLTKPVISFTGCMVLLVIALFVDSPFILGNGAMTIRCVNIIKSEIALENMFAATILTVLFCILIGSMCIRKMDIIGMEE